MQLGPAEAAQRATLNSLVQQLLVAQHRHRQPSGSCMVWHVLPALQQQQQQG
jgi:hypothetical protein